LPAQPGLPAAPTRLTAQPASAYQPPRRRNDWPIIILVGGVLVLLICITAAAVGWWQRERIPLLSSLLSQPTATSTPSPQPTRTPRSTSTRLPSITPVPTEPPIVITATATKSPISKLCLLPAGNIDDSGFNALAWSGVQSAAAEYGAQSAYIESKSYTDAEFVSAITQFLPQGCNLIVGVGQLTAEAIHQTAIRYPQQKFLLLDAILDTPLPNVWVQTYASDQGAFLAGYLAATVSKTGKVGTFGGMEIPPVRSYMNGFAAGVSYYNTKHNTNVLALGWNIAHQSGLFANDFNKPQQGQILARELFNLGADILFPVAGPTGYGAAAEASTRSSTYIIGVDDDWAVSKPEYASIILTSVEKRLDTSILLAAAAIAGNNFEGGEHIGTISSEITLAPYHQLEWMVPASLQAELEQVKADILSGKINTQAPSKPAGELVRSDELTLWVSDSSPEHLNRWVTKYREANPYVKVNIVSVPSAEFVDRWKASVAAGEGPDLLLHDNPLMFPEWARSGLMLPLDDLLAGKLDGIYSTALANLAVDGKLYGVPYISYSLALFYNKKLVSNPPKTMDELASLVRQGKKISLLRNTYFLFSFFTAFSGEVVDSNGRCIADQKSGFVEALRYLQTLAKNGAMLSTDYSAVADSFRNGQAAMTINGAWILTDYQDSLGDNLGVALIPRESATAAPVINLSAFFVNPNSRSPQLAVDLALFLASPEAQADLDVGYISVRTDLTYEAGDPMGVFAQSAEAGYPEIRLTNNFYSPFEAMITAVLENGSDPASALRDACQEMNTLNGK
jgi:basic membrane protein A